MRDGNGRLRQLAVKRFMSGESPESICASLHKSKFWLYKWVKRFDQDNPDWFMDLSRRPHNTTNRTPAHVERLVILIRQKLEKDDLFCGAQAIRWELEDLDLRPLPSLRSINRIIVRHGLAQRRPEHYQPKGTAYPVLPSHLPNQTHQADFLGPFYLRGPVRCYSLNVIDTATVRCGLHAALSTSAQTVVEGLWAIWERIGIPERIQVDNALSFYGSRRFPRGMGALIRICLHHGVEPWFIPLAEPWRNALVENFNDRYQQRFLAKVHLTSLAELQAGSLAFEQRHNYNYRYSRLFGKTPLKALAGAQAQLRFPTTGGPPTHPLAKPETGRYHVVRLIRSDLLLDVFGERFPAPPETQYQYVVATIDVTEQKLKLFQDDTQIAEYPYQLR